MRAHKDRPDHLARKVLRVRQVRRATRGRKDQQVQLVRKVRRVRQDPLARRPTHRKWRKARRVHKAKLDRKVLPEPDSIRCKSRCCVGMTRP